MKCFLCWLKGHKWWITQKYDEIDSVGQVWHKKKHFKTTNCQRCGEVNPDTTVLPITYV